MIYSVVTSLWFFLFSTYTQARTHLHSDRLASHDGYVSSLDEEKDHEYVEVILPQEPPPTTTKQSWTKKIFDDENLAKEFKDKYELQFGRTEAEQAQGISNPFAVVDLFNPQGQVYRGTAIDDQNQRQIFAQYMLKRMVEQNLDRFVKNEPAIRAVYEIKERVSKADVSVAPGYSFSLNFNFSSNQMVVKAINPYAIVEFILAMYPGATLGNTYEQYYRIGKQLTKQYSINCYYRQFDDVISLIGRDDVMPGKAYTLTMSTNTRPYGRANRENLTLAGMVWQF